MSNLKEIAKDLVHYTPARILPSIIRFFALSFYTRYLSPEEWGNYTLVISAVTIISAFTITWMSQANIRLFDKYSNNEEKESYLSTTIILFLLINTIVLIIWLIVVFFIKENLDQQLYFFLIIGSVFLFSESAYAFSGGFLRAQRNSKEFMIQNIIKSIATVVIAVLLIKFANIGAEIILVTSSLFSLIFFIRVIRSLMKRWKISKSKISINIFQNTLRYGIPLSLTAIAGYGLTLSDRFILNLYFGSKEVGIYSAGYRLSEMSILLISGLLVFTAFPIIIKAYETEGESKTQKLIKQLSGLYIYTIIPIVTVMVLYTKEIVDIVLGSEFNEAYKIIPFIAIGAFFYGLAQYINKAFELTEKTKYLFLLLFISSLITIGLNFILVPKLHYVGAGISGLSGYVSYFILSIIFSNRILKWEIPWGTIWKSVLSIMISIIPCLLIDISNKSVFHLIVSITMMFVGYLVMTIVLKEKNIMQIINNVRKQN